MNINFSYLFSIFNIMIRSKYVDVDIINESTIKPLMEYVLVNSFNFNIDIKRNDSFKREDSTISFNDALNEIMKSDFHLAIQYRNQNEISKSLLDFWSFGLSSLSRPEYEIFIFLNISIEKFEDIKNKFGLKIIEIGL